MVAVVMMIVTDLVVVIDINLNNKFYIFLDIAWFLMKISIAR